MLTMSTGIVALISESNGGVYQYAQIQIKALSEDKEHSYFVIAEEGSKIAAGLGLDIVYVPSRYLKPFRQGVLLILSYLGFGWLTKLIFGYKERALFSAASSFVACVSNPYPLIYLDKPYIFTLHDMQEKYYPDFFSFAAKQKRHMVAKLMTHQCQYVICESNYVKSDIHQYYDVPLERIYNIPAPPLTQAKKSDFICDDDVRETYHLPEHYIFYPSSNFWTHKNHLNLIKAIGILNTQRNYRVNVVMSGDYQTARYAKNVKAIKELAHCEGLDESVYLIGYVDYEHLYSIYKMADVIVIPTLFESISIPMYEAFSIGTPVCCSNVVALPEQAGDAALLFDPQQPNDIADSIFKLLEDDSTRSKLVSRGKKRIDQLTLESYSRSLIEMIWQ